MGDRTSGGGQSLQPHRHLHCMQKEHSVSTKDILPAETNLLSQQEINEKTEMWMNFVIEDCLELVAWESVNCLVCDIAFGCVVGVNPAHDT